MSSSQKQSKGGSSSKPAGQKAKGQSGGKGGASSNPAKRSAPMPGQQDRLKYQGKMLEEIMAWKREEVPARQKEFPIATLRALAETVPDPLDFAAALRQPGVSLIAEVKRASPSRGLLCHDFDPAKLADVYARGGAAAISVLTDSRYFQGQLEHLTTVKETLAGEGEKGRGEERRPGLNPHPLNFAATRLIPVLRKDFIYDTYQIVEARVAGADAILLIVAVLSDADLRRLLGETHRYGMQALVEVHDEVEVERALAAGAQIIGVNNRDLRTFAVDLQTTARLRPLIPADRVMVSESGIHGPDAVRRLADLGVDAMLVGETLVSAPAAERLNKVRQLVKAGKK